MTGIRGNTVFRTRPVHQARTARLAAALALLSAFAAPACLGSSTSCSSSSVPCFEATQATVPQSGGSSVPLQGNVDRMISYRHQQHSWQTADGYLHLMVNTGLPFDGGGNGLTLYTSANNGQTWTADLSLANSGSFSTSDGLLVGNTLDLAYSGNDVGGGVEGGSIFYVVLTYNPTLHTWSAGPSTSVYAASSNSAQYVALNPAIVVDAQNRIWCAYVRETLVAYNPNTPPYPTSNIRMSVGTTAAPASPSQPSWQDTGLTFGTTDSNTGNVERSARPVLMQNGIGMIYTVHQSFFWSLRLNTWSVNRQWSAPASIFTESPPYDSNPYSSHFSEVEDSSNNIHLAFCDHQRLLYMTFAAANLYWNQPRVIMPATNTDGSSTSATYPKISLVQSSLGSLLEIFVNDDELVRGYQSTNNGSTFTYAYLLAHDNITSLGDPSNGTDGFNNPRVETPVAWTSSTTPVIVPVLQQYENGSSGASSTNFPLNDVINQVMSFQVTLGD
jgi:hypothetical protein